MPVDRRERPFAETGARVAAVADRVERLDELVALAVLTQGHVPRERAIHLVLRPGVDPNRDAFLHVRRHLPDPDRADDEQPDPGGDVRDPSGRDVQHREEDPEVQKTAAEVTRLEQDEHGQHPDDEHRPEIVAPLDAQARHRVAREEEHRADAEI